MVLEMRSIFICRRWLCCVVVGLWSGLLETPCVAQDHPSATQLSEQAQRCRRLLQSSVIDFYLPAAVDQEHGGYWENLGPDGKFVGTDVKFLTLQGRQLWFFSTLAQEGLHRDQALSA